MKVVIICEQSGTIRDAFSKLGHESWSCDVESSESPENELFHIQDDALNVINDGWDLAICHPPCTYLSYVGNRHWNKPGRAALREKALEFFMTMINAPIDKICVENPVGYPNTVYRKPDQIIHPYYFGNPYQKRTCLWLKNLPLLKYEDTIIKKPAPLYICEGEKSKGKAINWVEGIKGTKNRSKARSKTFQGIADAMAEQWGSL